MDEVTDDIRQKILKLYHTLPNHTPWEDIKIDTIYHVPRVYTQSPMDILVQEKYQFHLKCIIRMDGITYVNQMIKRGDLTAVLMAEKREF